MLLSNALKLCVFCLISIIISGCTINGENASDEEQNITQIPATAEPDGAIPPAPEQLFLYPNSSESFQFWDHEMSISYLSAFPHTIEITIDGISETIEIDRSTPCPGSHCGYYAARNDIEYFIKPVVWKYNEEGERIWSFETWNTSELYFEAHIKIKK